MRLVAERLLPAGHKPVYVPDEASHQPLQMSALAMGRRFHLYVSPHNVGGSKVAAELSSTIKRMTKASPSAGANPSLQPAAQLPQLTTSSDERSGAQPGRPDSRASRRSQSFARKLRRKALARRGIGLGAKETAGDEILLTEDIDQLGLCEHMLVYLTNATWCSGEISSGALEPGPDPHEQLLVAELPDLEDVGRELPEGL